MVYTDNTYASDAVFLGIIEDAQPADMDTQGRAAPADKNPGTGERRLVTFRQKNKFAVGDVIEIMRPDGTDLQARVLGMWNEEGTPVPDAPHPGELIRMELDAPAEAGNIMRTWKQA